MRGEANGCLPGSLHSSWHLAFLFVVNPVYEWHYSCSFADPLQVSIRLWRLVLLIWVKLRLSVCAMLAAREHLSLFLPLSVAQSNSGETIQGDCSTDPRHTSQPSAALLSRDASTIPRCDAVRLSDRTCNRVCKRRKHSHEQRHRHDCVRG